MWNKVGACVLLLVATTFARSSKEGHSSWDEPVRSVRSPNAIL